MTKLNTSVITLGLAAFLLCGVVSAEEAAPAAPATAPSADSVAMPASDIVREDHPDKHIVVKGDTLWDISNRFLKNPWMWPEIWHVNPQIANPHLIYPGDTVRLIYLEGRPRLDVQRGEAGNTYKMSPASDASTGTADSAKAGGSDAGSNSNLADLAKRGEDKKLQPAVRVMPLEEPIPAIPLDVIDPFLSGSRIVERAAFGKAPYVVQGAQSHVITGAGGELYARGTFPADHSIYGIFREGKEYRDPVTDEVLGVQALDIGTGKIVSKEKQFARLNIVRSTEEIRPGDRLLINEERRVEPIFYPRVTETDLKDAVILDVEGGVNQVGAMSVIAINRGERDELQSGNVLAIFQRGEVVRDHISGEQLQLPEERAGLAMIFATFEKMSYAIVLYADRPLRVGDKLKKP